MHLMPSWYPYIDWDKSDLKIKVLKPDTPQEIKDDFEKYQEELRKPVHVFVDKQYGFSNKSHIKYLKYIRASMTTLRSDLDDIE